MELLEGFAESIANVLAGTAAGTDWIMVGLLFGSVLLAIFAVVSLMDPGRRFRTRVAEPALSPVPKRSLKQSDAQSTFDRLLAQLEKHVVKTNEEERTALRKRMMHAGYLNETAVRAYYLARLALAISLPVGFLLMAPVLWPAMQTKNLLFIAVGLCIAGLYLPYRFVQSKVENRQLAIVESFPDALDMMVVCVEAGLAFDATLVRVSEQIGRAHPILAALLAIVGLELRAGKSREEALQNLATRAGVQDVSNFVTLLIQSEALGADLSQTLKVQAEEMRANRMLRAEEKAHKLPVKLSMPLVAFILPAMFAVVLGPAMISIAENVLPNLGR